jgi:hypothetical protein
MGVAGKGDVAVEERATQKGEGEGECVGASRRGE